MSFICPDLLWVLSVATSRTVDHQNHNTLDNRDENLRLATRTQQNANQGLLSTNTSGFKGVCFDRNRKKWLAQLKAPGKKKFLGYFSTAEAAYAVYVKAATEAFVEFVCLPTIYPRSEDRPHPAYLSRGEDQLRIFQIPSNES